jgi:hypothetical protein
LFRRLAVFRSSFILEAAAAVAPAVGGDILSVLGGLVDKSLVTVVDGPPRGERRFRLLEPVRQYAADLLQDSGERDDAATRHRDHLRSRLPTQGDIFPGSPAYEGLAAEVDNVRAAVDHSMRNSEPESAVILILAYLRWWENLGLIDEQLDRLEAALGVADPARMSLGVQSAALSQASFTATYLGRVDKAAAFAELLAVLRDQHPDTLTVRASWAFAGGILTWFRAGGDRSRGNRLMQEAQDAYVARGMTAVATYPTENIVFAGILWDSVDDPDVASAIKDAARLAQIAGTLNVTAMVRVFDNVIRVMEGVRDAYPECLGSFDELDALDGGWLAEWGGLCVGVAAELVSDCPVATAHALRWVRWCRRSGVRLMLPCGIRAAARLSAIAGRPGQALRLWGGAEHTEAATSMRYMPLMQRLDRPHLQRCVDTLGPDAARLLAEGASWSISEATQAAEEALLRLQADNDES